MNNSTTGDLFGDHAPAEPRKDNRKESEIKALLDRLRQAEADRPKAEAALRSAQEDCAPYDAAWWQADEALGRAVNDPKSTPDSRRPYYDARMVAGYNRNPHRRLVKEVERWLKAISKEITHCHNALEWRQERPVRLVEGARMLSPRKPTAKPPRAV